ncbi:MAG: hypothetical protein ACRYG4_11315 [Janthinobacterium lividum]
MTPASLPIAAPRAQPDFGRVLRLALAVLVGLGSTSVAASEPSATATMTVSAVVLSTCQLDLATVARPGSRPCLAVAGHENLQAQPSVVMIRDAAGTITGTTLEF